MLRSRQAFVDDRIIWFMQPDPHLNRHVAPPIDQSYSSLVPPKCSR